MTIYGPFTTHGYKGAIEEPFDNWRSIRNMDENTLKFQSNRISLWPHGSVCTLLIFEKPLRNQHIYFSKWSICVIIISKEISKNPRECVGGVMFSEWKHQWHLLELWESHCRRGQLYFWVLPFEMFTREWALNKWCKQCQFIGISFVSKRLKILKGISNISFSDHNWKYLHNDLRFLKNPFKVMK